MSAIKTVAVLLLGVVLGATAMRFWPSDTSEGGESASGERKPLYWVAPMDPNYKRDKPGKSPMGMDLIPVYPEDLAGGSDSPGTVKISPDVINNLGVRTAPVQQIRMVDAIQTVGHVEYAEDLLEHVHSRVSGWVEKLYVRAEGDPVEKGQPLYEIYSPELVNAQEEYLLALQRGNKGLIEAAHDRLKALELSDQAIARLKKTRKVSQRVTMRAPAGGIVIKLGIREGFFVKPAKTLMSIGTLDEVWVQTEVYQRQADLVRAGDPVTVETDFLPGERFSGVVDYVYPALDPKTRTLPVRVKLANSDYRLKPNMYMDVRIEPQAAAKETLAVPREAVIRTGTMDRVVLALGDGKFKSVKVRLGRVNVDWAEILEGLESGDRVVTSAQFLLDSESSVNSDFVRMHHDGEGEPEPTEVWVEARVESVMADHGMLTLTHQAIPEWEWPEMTMDFTTAEGVDLSNVQPGMNIHVQIRKDEEGNYPIVAVHVPDEQGSTPADVTDTAWTEATVKAVMPDHRMLTLDHDPIPVWGWPAMQMDFLVDEAVDISQLKVGDRIRIQVGKTADGHTPIIGIERNAGEGGS